MNETQAPTQRMMRGPPGSLLSRTTHPVSSVGGLQQSGDEVALVRPDVVGRLLVVDEIRERRARESRTLHPAGLPTALRKRHHVVNHSRFIHLVEPQQVAQLAERDPKARVLNLVNLRSMASDALSRFLRGLTCPLTELDQLRSDTSPSNR